MEDDNIADGQRMTLEIRRMVDIEHGEDALQVHLIFHYTLVHGIIAGSVQLHALLPEKTMIAEGIDAVGTVELEYLI